MSWNNITGWSGINNPSGVWSYGHKPSPTGIFTIYPIHKIVLYSDGITIWGDPPGPHEAGCLLNTSSSVYYTIQPGQMSLHPGTGGVHSCLRWTSPVNDVLLVTGSFGVGDYGSTYYSIVKNGSDILFEGGPGTDNFSINVRFELGDTIDFIVGGASYAGNTPVYVDIGFGTGFTWTYAGYDEEGILTYSTDKIQGYGFFMAASEWNELIGFIRSQGVAVDTEDAVTGQHFTALQFNQVKNAINTKVATGLPDKVPNNVITAAELNILRDKANLL